MRCRGTKQQIPDQNLNRSTRYRKAIEEAGAFSINPPSIEELSGLRQEKGLRSSTDRRCQGGIEEVSSHILKPVFREEKNKDMNAIQHATQPMIQSTQ